VERSECPARPPHKGTVICRSCPLLPLRGALRPSQGPCQHLSATARSRQPIAIGPRLRHTKKRSPNATNKNTNTPNDGQPVPVDYQSVLASASGASQNASRRLAFLTSTPHALKLLERPIHDCGGGDAHEGPQRAVKILLTTAPQPSRPRLRRAASRSRSLDRRNAVVKLVWHVAAGSHGHPSANKFVHRERNHRPSKRFKMLQAASSCFNLLRNCDARKCNNLQ
jgi:hypothetical protein